MQRWPWQVSVWTRFRGTPAEVWALQTDPDKVRAMFGPLVSFRIADAAGFRAAVAGASPGRFEGRVSGPFGLFGLAWPFELQEVKPLESFVDASENRLFESFVHRHRLEAATDGFVRYTDEVRFVPRRGPEALIADVVKRLFVRRHLRAAQWMEADPQARGVSIVRRVNPVGAAYEEPDMDEAG